MSKKFTPKYYVAQMGVATKTNPQGYINPYADLPQPKYSAPSKFLDYKNYASPMEATGSSSISAPNTVQTAYPAPNASKNKFTPQHGLFYANAAMTGVTAIANEVNSGKAAMDEAAQYRKALQPTSYENMERYSLNTNPAYMQTGGQNPLTKGLIPQPSYNRLSNSGSPMGDTILYNTRFRDFGVYGEQEFDNKFVIPSTIAATREGQDPNMTKKLLADLPMYESIRSDYKDRVMSDQQIKAELDKPYKQMPDIKKKQMGGQAFGKKYVGNAEQFDHTPNPTDHLRDDVDISELISYHIVNGGTPTQGENGKGLFNQMQYKYGIPQAQKLMTDLSLFNQDETNRALSPEDRIRRYYESGDPALTEFKKGINRFGTGAVDTYNSATNVLAAQQQGKGALTMRQAGGDIPVGNSVNRKFANVEAEKGEVYTDMAGDVKQVDPQGKTHEQGGEFIPNVHRVLENTSNLRKDKNSKYLKLEPQQIKAMTGLDTRKEMSHAEALIKSNEAMEKLRSKIVKNIELSASGRRNLDKYGENASKLNLEHFKSLPTKGELFDRLFNHQEHIKAVTGVQDDGKSSKYGGYKMQLGGYAGSKLKLKTPAGNPDAFPANMKFEDYLKGLDEAGFKYEGIKDNSALQKALYEYKLKNKEYDDIRNMWQEGMHLDGMQKARELGFVDEKGMFKEGILDSEDNLKKLGEIYPDGKLGPRLLKLAKAPAPRIWSDEPTAEPTKAPINNPKGVVNDTTNFIKQPQSRFNEPLKWFDVASPIGTFLNSDRLAEKYNPAQVNQLQLKLQDPTQALNQNQSDYNAAIQAVQSTSPENAGVQLANISALASRKYALNNQVYGNTENANSQIKNQEIMYNTAVRDKQSLLDQHSREVFEDKVLTSKATQQEQKLVALDSLYKTIAENRALNRNGNLIMKFSRAFDQYGDYNGYQSKFAPNPRLGLGQPVEDPAKTNDAGRLQRLQNQNSYRNLRSGKMYYFDGNQLLER